MENEIFQGQDFRLNPEEEWKMIFFCENFLFSSSSIERIITNVSSLNTTQRLAYGDLVKGVWNKTITYLPPHSIEILVSVYQFGKNIIDAEGELSYGNGPINDVFKKTIKSVKQSAAMPFINFLFKVFDEKLKLSSSFMFELGSIAPAKSLNLLIKNKRMILKTNLPVVKREITSQTLVEDLSISSALKSRLISNGYNTVFDIQKGSIDGLKIKGFGPKRISAIEKELSSLLN